MAVGQTAVVAPPADAPRVVAGVDVGGTKTLALLVAVEADGTPVVLDREQVRRRAIASLEDNKEIHV